MGKDPKASVEITAHSKSLKGQLREARAKFSGFGEDLSKNLFGKETFSKGAATALGNLASSGISAFGGMLVSQGRDVLEFNDSLTRLRITAGKTPEEMQAFAESVRKTSSTVGIGAKEILDGAAAYVALTGDMDGAAAMSNTFARVAQATNSTVGDIAQTAAALKQQMNINPAQMEEVFGVLTVQGKKGAIELKDLAAQMSSIAPQWAQFGDGKGVQGVKELGAALQIVKRGFGGDASETVTGLQSFLNGAMKNAGRLKKGGFDVYTKDAITGEKHLKNVLEIVDGIANSKLAKDPTKLTKALGRTEAYRAYLQLRDNRTELQGLVDDSSAAGVIQADLAKYQASASGQAKIALQSLKNEVADAFTPDRIEKFTVALKAMILVARAGFEVVTDFLDKTKRFSEAVAGMIYGDSEEEKARKMQNAHRSERVRQTAGQMLLGDYRTNSKLSKLELMNKADKQVAKEDADLKFLAEGKRIGGGKSDAIYSTVPVFDTSNGKTRGQFIGNKQTQIAGGSESYSVQELMALKNSYGVGGVNGRASNAGNIKAEIDHQISAQVAASIQAQTKAIIDAMGGVQTNVKIGAEPVVKATRNAQSVGRKPHQ